MDTGPNSWKSNTRNYRRSTPDEKRQIVEETLPGGRSVTEIARSREANVNQVFDWRKQYLERRVQRQIASAQRSALPSGLQGKPSKKKRARPD